VPLEREAPTQKGLPGVAAEESPLPSEQVLSGERLGERSREALTGLRAALGERPDGFEVEEWRVVLAVLAPPVHAGHIGGATARESLARRARECFPGFPISAALKAFREVQTRPHVAEVIADFRALEGVDLMEQRAMLRDIYQVGLSAMEALRPGKGEKFAAWIVDDPAGAAKVISAAVNAGKALAELDGLKLTPVRPALGADGEPPGPTKPPEDPRASVAEKMALVFEDVHARRVAIDATVSE
jgi:hypothetical protein